MNKKIILPVIVVILLLVAGLVYMNQSQENSLTPTETPSPTSTPTPVPTETPTPTETPESASTTSNESTDTSGKVEVSPGVYSDGTVRTPSIEEWESMTKEEKDTWNDAYAKANGFGSSMEDLGGEHVTDEEFKDFMDETWNLDNPDIQDILNSGVLDN